MKRIGIRISVATEVNVKPNIIDQASGAHRAEARVSGAIPIIVVTVVRSIGLNLETLPSTTTSVMDFRGCFSRLWLMVSIRMMALFTTIPERAIRPISEGKESACPVRKRPINIPTNAVGITEIINTANLIELN